MDSTINAYRCICYYISTSISFSRDRDGVEQRSSGLFRGPMETVNNASEIDLVESQRSLSLQLDDYTKNGSDWVVENIQFVTLHLGQYHPLVGGANCEIPDYLKNKRYILNLGNTGEKCFMWIVLAHIYPVPPKKHPENTKKYADKEKTLNFEGISFPVKLTQISLFEKKKQFECFGQCI